MASSSTPTFEQAYSGSGNASKGSWLSRVCGRGWLAGAGIVSLSCAQCTYWLALGIPPRLTHPQPAITATNTGQRGEWRE